MDKYYKVEDVHEALQKGNHLFEAMDLIAKVKDLPTIEVSENAVSRNAVDKMLDEAWVDGFEYQGDLFRDLAKIPSVIPAQPNIEYILSQLVDLLDEYSELDEHGLHRHLRGMGAERY